MSDYKLTPLNVTIHEVLIGNKKLIKSVFNQIELDSCFNEKIEFVGDAIIGYIKDKDLRYLLWVKDGKLRKTNLALYYKLKTNVEWASLDATVWFLRKTKLKFFESDDYRDRLSEGLEDKDKYLKLVKKTHLFLDMLTDKQVFL